MHFARRTGSTSPASRHGDPVPTVSRHDDDATAQPRTRRRSPSGARRRLSSPPPRRTTYALALALVSVLAAADLLAGEPAANATAAPDTPSVQVAAALGIDGSGVDEPAEEAPLLLDQLVTSRSQRDAEQSAAVEVQAQAEQAAEAARAEAEARAAAEAAAAAAAAQAAAAAAAAQAAAAADRTETSAASATTAAAATTVADVIAKINNSAGAVRPQAQAAADAVVSNVPGAAGITIGGTRASAADPGGHPSGLALDFMCSSSLGDAIAEYHIAHWDELGVEYVIWKQRMLSSPGGSWKMMENRGGATANHMDHVHVNYR